MLSPFSASASCAGAQATGLRRDAEGRLEPPWGWRDALRTGMHMPQPLADVSVEFHLGPGPGLARLGLCDGMHCRWWHREKLTERCCVQLCGPSTLRMPASPMSFMYRLRSFRCARLAMSAMASAPASVMLRMATPPGAISLQHCSQCGVAMVQCKATPNSHCRPLPAQNKGRPASWACSTCQAGAGAGAASSMLRRGAPMAHAGGIGAANLRISGAANR